MLGEDVGFKGIERLEGSGKWVRFLGGGVRMELGGGVKGLEGSFFERELWKWRIGEDKGFGFGFGI